MLPRQPVDLLLGTYVPLVAHNLHVCMSHVEVGTGHPYRTRTGYPPYRKAVLSDHPRSVAYPYFTATGTQRNTLRLPISSPKYGMEHVFL